MQHHLEIQQEAARTRSWISRDWTCCVAMAVRVHRKSGYMSKPSCFGDGADAGTGFMESRRATPGMPCVPSGAKLGCGRQAATQFHAILELRESSTRSIWRKRRGSVTRDRTGITAFGSDIVLGEHDRRSDGLGLSPSYRRNAYPRGAVARSGGFSEANRAERHGARFRGEPRNCAHDRSPRFRRVRLLTSTSILRFFPSTI